MFDQIACFECLVCVCVRLIELEPACVCVYEAACAYCRVLVDYLLVCAVCVALWLCGWTWTSGGHAQKQD